MSNDHASNIYLFVRRTTDWSNEQVFRSQLPPAFAPKVETWNQTFNIPYHVFRHRLCEIANENQAAVGAPKTDCWDDIPSGAIVMPTDDDDWFVPNAAHRVAATMEPLDEGCHWTQSVLQVPINGMHGVKVAMRRVFPFIRPKWFCATNNYAFVKTAGAENLIPHTRASRSFESGQLRLARLDERLSIHNRNIASITSMGFGQPHVSAAQLRRKAAQYRRLYERPSLPPGLEWTAPSIERMAKLMDELRTP